MCPFTHLEAHPPHTPSCPPSSFSRPTSLPVCLRASAPTLPYLVRVLSSLQELSSAAYALACLAYPASPRWLAGLRAASMRAMSARAPVPAADQAEGPTLGRGEAHSGGGAMGAMGPQAMANLLWALAHLDPSLGYAEGCKGGSRPLAAALAHSPSSGSGGSSGSKGSSSAGSNGPGSHGSSSSSSSSSSSCESRMSASLGGAAGRGGEPSMATWLRSFWTASQQGLGAWPTASLAVVAVCLARIQVRSCTRCRAVCVAARPCARLLQPQGPQACAAAGCVCCRAGHCSPVRSAGVDWLCLGLELGCHACRCKQDMFMPVLRHAHMSRQARPHPQRLHLDTSTLARRPVPFPRPCSLP